MTKCDAEGVLCMVQKMEPYIIDSKEGFRVTFFNGCQQDITWEWIYCFATFLRKKEGFDILQRNGFEAIIIEEIALASWSTWYPQ